MPRSATPSSRSMTVCTAGAPSCGRIKAAVITPRWLKRVPSPGPIPGTLGRKDAQAAADQQAKTDIYAAAGIVRMAPGEIDRPASGDFSAKRSAYLAAVMTLPVADRFAEVKAVAAALDCGANVITVGDLTRARKRAKGD